MKLQLEESLFFGVHGVTQIKSVLLVVFFNKVVHRNSLLPCYEDIHFLGQNISLSYVFEDSPV